LLTLFGISLLQAVIKQLKTDMASAMEVKGSSYSSLNGTQIKVWDSTNVVFPHIEPDAVFITTNFQMTPNQTRQICQGNDNETEHCVTNCPPLTSTLNGVTNGNCTNGYCDLYAWCPLETPTPKDTTNILHYIPNFTVYLKNNARWESWGYSLDNFHDGQQNGVNLFTVQQMVQNTGYNTEDMLDTGGVIGVIIHWTCNFDHDPEECKPEFQFLRLDNPQSTLSSGFNFRYVNYFRTGDNALESRDLYKVYGIRIFFLTFANGSKFNIVSLFINLGSGFGMMVLANYLSDLICMWLLRNSAFYRNRKYMNVDEQHLEAMRQEWKGILTPEQLNKAYF